MAEMESTVKLQEVIDRMEGGEELVFGGGKSLKGDEKRRSDSDHESFSNSLATKDPEKEKRMKQVLSESPGLEELLGMVD